MYDIITIGSSTVDVFAKTEYSELIKIKSKGKAEVNFLAYPTGSKILVEEINFTTGGGATNTAVSLSRLGHKVACISKMGCGPNSELIKKDLKKEKIETSLMVCDKKGRTGYSIVLDSIEHDRTILTFKGSNNNLKFNELNLKNLNTRWFYFSTMMDESFKTLERLANFANKKGIKIAFNASSYLAEKGIDYSKNILKYTDIFVLNKEEAASMTKKNNIQDMLKEICKLVKITIITDGANEAVAYDREFTYSIKPNKVKVVETTGAGDAFASAFLSGMIKKNNIEFALALAMANSESVIQHHGAKNKLLTYGEALNYIKKQPHKIIKRKL
ncbi:MAG: carbohydrate kinase family protein [Nanoarchaeota archaeon]